jgi:hypothetical protein
MESCGMYMVVFFTVSSWREGDACSASLSQVIRPSGYRGRRMTLDPIIVEAEVRRPGS